MCVDQPYYLSKALGHDNSEGTGLNTMDQKKEMLKYFYKSWSGLVKFIYNQCAQKKKCVDFPLVGRFIARESIPLAVKNDENCEGMFSFIPHIDFVSSGRFSFP